MDAEPLATRVHTGRGALLYAVTLVATVHCNATRIYMPAWEAEMERILVCGLGSDILGRGIPQLGSPGSRQYLLSAGSRGFSRDLHVGYVLAYV